MTSATRSPRRRRKNIARGDLDLGDAESETAKKETEDIAKKNDDLIKDIKETLGEKVADVKVSQRLKTSAVCLVADEMGPSLSMEQTFAEMNNPLFKAKRILELNPHHDLSRGGQGQPGFQGLLRFALHAGAPD